MRLVRIKKAPAKPGKAVQAKWTTRHELAKLNAIDRSKRSSASSA